MRRSFRVLAIVLVALAGQAQQKKGARRSQDPGPQPRVVTPGTGGAQAPSDAIVLFDGKDVAGWTKRDGSPTGCTAEKGEMVCATGSGDVVSKETFTDAQIHLEFNVPHMPDQSGQRRGNSGVYLQACYEVQILDSHENPTYPDGSNGAVYGFAAPMVNASRKPGEWQSFDMLYRAPRCNAEGEITEAGRVTVVLNGVLIQDNVKLDRRGAGCRRSASCGNGPLLLQDHSGFPNAPHTVMKFRNIWLRKLD